MPKQASARKCCGSAALPFFYVALRAAGPLLLVISITKINLVGNPLRERPWKLLLILVFVTGTCQQTFAQQPGYEYEFLSYGPRNGLASAEIITIFQDSRRYLWIGHTAGVSRYDGHHFETIPADRLTGKTWCFLEDADGEIWVGAERGLFCYSGQTLKAVDLQKIFPVYAICASPHGGYWLGTSEGPARFSHPALQQARTTLQLPLISQVLPAWKKKFPQKNITRFLTVDRSGASYFCDSYTIYRYAGDQLSTWWESGAKGLDFVTGLTASGADSIYLSAALTGFHAVQKGRDTMLIPPAQGIGINLQKKNDRLFHFGSKGIYEAHPKQRNFSTVVQLPAPYQEWGSCILNDQENNWWIGTHEQLVLARRNFFHLVKQPSLDGFDELYSAFQLRNGTMLTTGNHGKLFRQVPGKDSFYLWKTIFDKAELEAMYEYPDGDLLFTSGYQGVALLHQEKLSRYTKAQGLRDHTNRFLLPTRNGRIFIGGDGGVSEVFKDQAGSLRFKNFTFLTGSTDYSIFRGGAERSNGQLFFGGTYGLFAIQKDSLMPVNILQSKGKNYPVTDLLIDTKDQLWITTAGDGILLCSFNARGEPVLQKHFTETDGLSSLVYLRIVEDQQRMLWALDHTGLTRIDQSSNQSFSISNYGQAQGYLHNDYHSAKMIRDARGWIWVATTSGLATFNPAGWKQFVTTPTLMYTRILLPDGNTDPVSYASGTDPQTGLPANLRLPHHANTLVVDYNSIQLSNAGAIHYVYRLSATDSQWIDAGTARRITLRNLPPGKHTLQLKATATGNQWSQPVSFHFTILPPFYTRWWFIALATLLTGWLIYLFVRSREKTIQEKEAQKTELQSLRAVSFQYQLEIEQVINYFATSMSLQQNVDDLLWDVARKCIAKLDFEDCVIYLKDETRPVLLQKAAWGPKTTGLNMIHNPIEIPLGKGIVGTVARTGMSEIIADTSKDPRYIVDDARRLSEITVPIANHGKVIGVIDSEHSQKDFYTARHLQILTTLASLLADRIDKMKAVQAVHEREIELITLHRDLATSQLTALRAQMSPHFIFNALNSIQQYILQGNVDQANRYLSKFSRLQREILHHCDQQWITLEKEIDMLQLYLALEQLRFNGTFSYTLTLGEGLDSDEIRIPPMLLQPFVENAIEHGLMPKQGDRQLAIHFALQGETLLTCIIHDNGIGRAAAAHLKEQSGLTGTHRSKGLLLTHERLFMLQQQYQRPFEASIEDLTDANGEPAGTLVKLVLFIGS